MKSNNIIKILSCVCVILTGVCLILLLHTFQLKSQLKGFNKEITLHVYNQNKEEIKVVEAYETTAITLKDVLVELNESKKLESEIITSTYGGYITSMCQLKAENSYYWTYTSSTNNSCVGCVVGDVINACQKGIDSTYLQTKEEFSFYLIQY